MRVAFADMLFSWPPNGGADIDLFHVLKGLQAARVEVRLFFASIDGADDRGVVTADALPFAVEHVRFEKGALRPELVAERFRKQVDTYRPDVVVASHAFALKPYLIRGLSHHPLVSRYYAHELTCARDPRRFKDGAPCPHDFLREPDVCRDCAVVSQRPFIVAENHRAFTADYLAAAAYRPAYHEDTLAALGACRTLVVYNATLRDELASFHGDVRVIPGGAAVRDIVPQPLLGGSVKTILMTGRADDPLKGLATFNEAGRQLWQQRQDFQMVVTHYDHAIQTPWLRCVGWRDHAGAMALYGEADIVVVPSVWHEPFGLAAVEAMASARPVVASRSGGLADIVRDGETGLLSTPGDAKELAAHLSRLLDDAALRQRMGAEGRRVAEAEYDWGVVVQRHYLPLLEELAR